MAVLAVVVLVAVAGAGMAHAVVIRGYDMELPRAGRTMVSDPPSRKATTSRYGEDQNSFIGRDFFGIRTQVRTRLVRDVEAFPRVTYSELIRSGQDVNLRFFANQNVVGRSFRLAQDVTIIGCPLRTTTSIGRWSPDRF